MSEETVETAGPVTDEADDEAAAGDRGGEEEAEAGEAGEDAAV